MNNRHCLNTENIRRPTSCASKRCIAHLLFPFCRSAADMSQFIFLTKRSSDGHWPEQVLRNSFDASERVFASNKDSLQLRFKSCVHISLNSAFDAKLQSPHTAQIRSQRRTMSNVIKDANTEGSMPPRLEAVLAINSAGTVAVEGSARGRTLETGVRTGVRTPCRTSLGTGVGTGGQVWGQAWGRAWGRTWGRA